MPGAEGFQGGLVRGISRRRACEPSRSESVRVRLEGRKALGLTETTREGASGEGLDSQPHGECCTAPGPASSIHSTTPFGCQLGSPTWDLSAKGSQKQRRDSGWGPGWLGYGAPAPGRKIMQQGKLEAERAWEHTPRCNCSLNTRIKKKSTTGRQKSQLNKMTEL